MICSRPSTKYSHTEILPFADSSALSSKSISLSGLATNSFKKVYTLSIHSSQSIGLPSAHCVRSSKEKSGFCFAEADIDSFCGRERAIAILEEIFGMDF